MQNETKNLMGGGKMEKTCKRCGRTLPMDNFGTHPRYGVKSVCKKCEHTARSNARRGVKKNPLAKFSKEELVAELQCRGLNIMASPTPREMMLRLKQLGYDGELKYTKVETIDISKLE